MFDCFPEPRCGNGLLVHILRECGYAGLGVDVRARKSWSHYPPSTRDYLHVYSFDPIALTSAPLFREPAVSPDVEDDGDPLKDPVLKMMFPMSRQGRFVIGNHADEMQPWVPVLAALTRGEYLSIPCCAWEFDMRFQMKKQARRVGEESGPVLSPEEEDLDRKLRYDGKDGRLGLYACKLT